MDSTSLKENGLGEKAPPDTTVSSPESMEEKTSESDHLARSGSSSSITSSPDADSPSQDESQTKDQGDTPSSTTYSNPSGTTPTQSVSISDTSPSTPGHSMSGSGHYRGSPRSIIQPVMPPYGTEDPKNNENISLSNYLMLMSLKKQQQHQALHGEGGMGSYPLLPPAVQISPMNTPTTLPPEYGAFQRAVTHHPHSQSPPSHNPTTLISAFNTHPSTKLVDPGVGQGYPLLSLQQTQGLLTLEPPNHGKHSPQHSQSITGYEVGGAGGGHVMQVPSGQSPLKVEGSDVETRASQKRRKRPLSHSGPGSGADNSEPDPSGYAPIRDKMFPSDTDGMQLLDTSGSGGQNQRLKWQAHMVNSWHEVCDGALQDIPQIGFQVETDKGFNLSTVDDAFVCQKKNHFQVTVQIQFHRTPKFLKMKDGSIQPISTFTLHLHGVKFEQIKSMIPLERSLTDRTKVKFDPVIIEVPAKPDTPLRTTICRLHFSETTANNMRKRGKPNPDQKYFSLVVALHADTGLGSFPVVAHVSERIIVRASNPANFDNECDYCWLRGCNPEVTYHHGRVGINTEKPDEAFTVHGNIQLTGQILQASDIRVKHNIKQVDHSDHLHHVSQLQLYEYQLDNGILGEGGGTATQQPLRRQVGLLAQEVKEVIPDAVKGSHTKVCLADGSTVSELLVVDKDRVLMETLGAVQELKQIADQLSRRLDALEKGDAELVHHKPHCSSYTKQPRAHSSHGTRGWVLSTIIFICILVFLISLLFLVVQSSTQTSLIVPMQESGQSINSRTHLFGRIFKFWVQR